MVVLRKLSINHFRLVILIVGFLGTVLIYVKGPRKTQLRVVLVGMNCRLEVWRDFGVKKMNHMAHGCLWNDEKEERVEIQE